MSVKYRVRDDRMQSLYSLAWRGQRASSEGAADPMFSGFDAAEAGNDANFQVEEALLLDTRLTFGGRAEVSPEEIIAIRDHKQLQAERVLHLLKLGYTGF